jgi:hypothetical protein
VTDTRGLAVRMDNGVVRHLSEIKTASEFLRSYNGNLHTWFRTDEGTLVSSAHVAEVMGATDD